MPAESSSQYSLIFHSAYKLVVVNINYHDSALNKLCIFRKSLGCIVAAKLPFPEHQLLRSTYVLYC